MPTIQTYILNVINEKTKNDFVLTMWIMYR